MSGLYAADGSLNVSVVAGTSFTGLYAADGSWNIIHDTTNNGPYHPCGALRVTHVTTNQTDIYAADGSLNVSVSPYVTNSRNITVVSGVLA